MLTRGQRPTQHTTGAFLDALKRSRQADRCVSVYAEMMDSGVDLGDVCFNIVVSALVQVRNEPLRLAFQPIPMDAGCGKCFDFFLVYACRISFWHSLPDGA